jgi:hypothetical protein
MAQSAPRRLPGPARRVYGPRGGSGSEGSRCVRCGGALYRTKATGRPQHEDHQPGCEFFVNAVQVMRYAEELQRTASEPTNQGASRNDRRHRQYLQKIAKKLSAAACGGDPVQTVMNLAAKCAAEYEKGTKQAGDAEIVMKACQALAQGKDPAPIIPSPTSPADPVPDSPSA